MKESAVAFQMKNRGFWLWFSTYSVMAAIKSGTLRKDPRRMQRRFHDGGHLACRYPGDATGTGRILLQPRQSQRQKSLAPELNGGA